MFHEIIKKIPAVDLGIEGLEVHVDHTPRGTIYFVSSEKELDFPAHSHPAQWTVVVSGECELTIGDETKTYKKGDTYFIPANAEHKIKLSANYAEFDYIDGQL